MEFTLTHPLISRLFTFYKWRQIELMCTKKEMKCKKIKRRREKIMVKYKLTKYFQNEHYSFFLY